MSQSPWFDAIPYRGIPKVYDGGFVCEGSKHVPTGSVHVIKSGRQG